MIVLSINSALKLRWAILVLAIAFLEGEREEQKGITVKRQHAFKRHYAKRHYAKSHYTKRHYAKTQHAKKQQALRLNDKNSKERLIFHMMALSINSAPAR